MSARGYVDHDGDIWVSDEDTKGWAYLTDGDLTLANPDGVRLQDVEDLAALYGPLHPISEGMAEILLAQARRNAREGGPL